MVIVIIIWSTGLISRPAKQFSLREIIVSLQDLAEEDQRQLLANLEQVFGVAARDEKFQENEANSIRAVVAAGIFEEVQAGTIATVAYKARQAVANGAPVDYVNDLAVIGFSFPITESQLEWAARSIKLMTDNSVQSYIVDEIIAYGIYNQWTGKTIDAVSNGIVEAVKQGLDAQKAALYLIISVDQAAKRNETIRAVVTKSIEELHRLPAKQEWKDRAFARMRKSVEKGVPTAIANEIVTTAIREKWSQETIQAVFSGLEKGVEIGLSLEKVGTAFIVRIAQGLTVSADQMVQEELAYVKQLEAKKIETIQRDKQEFKRQPRPIYQYQLGYTQPDIKVKRTPQQPVTYFPSTHRTSINEPLMWQTIREYLGPPPTPYRWGGTTRYGIDCSGFTQAVYKQLGVFLPRTSRQQFRIGIPVSPQAMRFGDLVFFSKYFNDYITHVGVYIGNGNFAHSSCSRGVSIASLNQRYYRLRYRGARRIVQ